MNLEFSDKASDNENGDIKSEGQGVQDRVKFLRDEDLKKLLEMDAEDKEKDDSVKANDAKKIENLRKGMEAVAEAEVMGSMVSGGWEAEAETQGMSKNEQGLEKMGLSEQAVAEAEVMGSIVSGGWEAEAETLDAKPKNEDPGDNAKENGESLQNPEGASNDTAKEGLLSSGKEKRKVSEAQEASERYKTRLNNLYACQRNLENGQELISELKEFLKKEMPGQSITLESLQAQIERVLPNAGIAAGLAGIDMGIEYNRIITERGTDQNTFRDFYNTAAAIEKCTETVGKNFEMKGIMPARMEAINRMNSEIAREMDTVDKTCKITGGQAEIFWKLAIGKKNESNEKLALKVLLRNLGRKDYQDIVGAEGFVCTTDQDKSTGVLKLNVTRKDDDGNDKTTEFSIDMKNYSPGIIGRNLGFIRRHEVELRMKESKGKKEENRTEKEGGYDYKKTNEFLKSYEDFCRNQAMENEEDIKKINKMKGLLKQEDETNVITNLEAVTTDLDKALQGDEWDEASKKRIKELRNMAKEAIDELKKIKAEKEKNAESSRRKEPKEPPKEDTGEVEIKKWKSSDIKKGEVVTVINKYGAMVEYRRSDDLTDNIFFNTIVADGKAGNRQMLQNEINIESGTELVDKITIRKKKGQTQSSDGENEEQQDSNATKEDGDKTGDKGENQLEKIWEKRREGLVKKYPSLKDFVAFIDQAGRGGKYHLIQNKFFESLDDGEIDYMQTYLEERGNKLEFKRNQTCFDNVAIERKYIDSITAGEWGKSEMSNSDLTDIRGLVESLLDGRNIGDYQLPSRGVNNKEAVKNAETIKPEKPKEMGEVGVDTKSGFAKLEKDKKGDFPGSFTPRQKNEGDQQAESIDVLNGEDIEEGKVYKIFAGGKNYRIWNAEGKIYLETENKSFRHMLDKDFRIKVEKEGESKENTLPLAGTTRVTKREPKENESALPMRKIAVLGKIEKIEVEKRAEAK